MSALRSTVLSLAAAACSTAAAAGGCTAPSFNLEDPGTGGDAGDAGAWNGDNDGGGGTDAGGRADVGTDAGADARNGERDSGTDAGAVDSGPPAKYGFVIVNEHSVSANFGLYTWGDPCKNDVQGACTVTTCTGSVTKPDGGPDASVPPDPNAGVISVDSASLTTPLTLTPNASTGAYDGAGGNIFAAFNWVHIHATGADVSPFDSTATAPGDLTVTAPSFATDPMPLSKGQDLTVRWTGGGADAVNVNVSLTSMNGVTDIKRVRCSFPAIAGAGTIPAALFDKVDAQGWVDVTPSVTTRFSAGDCLMTYTLEANGATTHYTVN